MRIAKVLLYHDNDEGFDYMVPEELDDIIREGSIVSVDFRKKKLIGLVVGFKSSSDAKNLKTIEKKIYTEDLGREMLDFMKWAGEYYFTGMGRIYRQFTPSEVEVKRRFVCVSKDIEHLELFIKSKEKPFTRSEAVKILKNEEVFEQLLQDKIVLEDVTAFSMPKKRDVKLSDEQEFAFNEIKNRIDSSTHKGYLLYGKPSTGKTEVYFKLIHHIIENTKKTVLLLFPEIGLADIFFKRVSEEFGSITTARIHSEMTEGESNFYFQKILNKEKRIIVGTRSAVFSPVKDLGLVIVDEEQDQSYKQFDASPYYNGRDCAVYRAFINNAPVLLVSATPSAESYANAKSGKYELLKLETRYLNTEQPEVKIIYNTVAHKNVATLAVDEVAKTLSQGKQVLLFLNRRGYLNLYKCSKCGEYFKCGNCSVSYSFHKSQREFVCHYCGSTKQKDAECPHCGGKISSAGVWGTEMVESVFSNIFPEAVIERFDTDSTRKKGERKRIIERVLNREAHILVGTQMVSKGYDIPNIHAVLILNADSIINIPDIRSEERFMQMLVQTSGRAGRREERGVIIVEIGPSGIHLKDFIENLDYIKFMEEELLRRKNHSFPPYKRMLRIMHKNKDREKAIQNMYEIYKMLEENRSKGVKVLPPGFNYVEKVNNLYRTEMFVIYSDMKAVKKMMLCIKADFEYSIDNDTL
ncbi:MAG: primosomal protein N' [bacterium]